MFFILFGLQPRLHRKPNNFTAKTFFSFFGLHVFLDQKATTFIWRRPCFFVLHLFLDRKRVTPRNPVRVAPSLATPLTAIRHERNLNFTRFDQLKIFLSDNFLICTFLFFKLEQSNSSWSWSPEKLFFRV